MLGFAADLLVGMVLEPDVAPADVAAVIDEIERSGGIPRLALARQAFQAPELLRLATADALSLVLELLLAFAALESLSLWTLGAGGTVAHLAHAGEFDAPVGPPRALARRLLEAGDPEMIEPPNLRGIGLGAYGRARAALIALGELSALDRLGPVVGAAAPTLVTLLALDERAANASSADGEATASAERRLRRLRFDLHDGPQQDVILLAEDLRLFRAQLSAVTQNYPSNVRMLGTLDDLQARLVALAGDLRRISTAVESPTLYTGSLPDAVARRRRERDAAPIPNPQQPHRDRHGRQAQGHEERGCELERQQAERDDRQHQERRIAGRRVVPERPATTEDRCLSLQSVHLVRVSPTQDRVRGRIEIAVEVVAELAAVQLDAPDGHHQGERRERDVDRGPNSGQHCKVSIGASERNLDH